MKQSEIFWPVLALMAWTLLVLLQVGIRRLRAGFSGRLAVDDFLCGESSRVPVDVALPNRVFMNLLEVPVLFYLLAILFYVTHTVDTPVIALAWLFVLLRLVHSLIYFTYNKVLHRFLAFALSNMLVLAMLVYLTVRLAA
jgi:hypothetical protein